jgi:chemotaxis response regulator CheB
MTKPPRKLARPSVDGHIRTADADAKINAHIAAALSTGAGKEMLAYMRSITQHTTCTPQHTDAELRHLEGMRGLVGIIMQRIEDHNHAQ